MRFRGGILSMLALLSATVPNAANASPGTTNAGAAGAAVEHATLRRYDAAFFLRFAPQNAADVVANVPGFRLAERSGDRGLGQAGANILIDGQRVVGKNIDISEVLAQIPAAAVHEVQVLDGARLPITGFSGLVVNIVLAEDGMSGTYEWNPEFRHRLPANLSDANISVVRSIPGGTLTLRAGNEASRRGAAGPERAFGPGGGLAEIRDENSESRFDSPFFAVALERESDGGTNLSLRGEVELPQLRAIETSLRHPLAGTPYVQEFASEIEGINAEASAELGGTIGAYEATFIGLYRREISDEKSLIDNGLASNPSRFRRFAQEFDLYEAVGRAELSRRLGDKLTAELGGEYVHNEIDVENRLAVAGTLGDTVLASFAPQRTVVAEDRFDVTLTGQYEPASALSIQASFALEHSTLSQTAPVSVERSFLRPKGYLRAALKAGPKTTFRAGIERDVGQIDFVDFATAIDLQENETDFGNSDLVPEIISVADVSYDRKLGAKSQLVVRGFVEIVEDTIDQIPLRNDEGVLIGNAIGNAGRSTSLGVEGDATFFLTPFSLPGAQLTLSGEWRDSEIADPLTLQDRPVSGLTNWLYEVTGRHDVGTTPYAYGFYLTDFEFFEEFRFAQAALFERSHPYANIFVEHKDVFGLRVVATLANVTDVEEEFRRTLYPGPRNETVPLSTEIRRRDFRPFLNLRITGTF